MPHRRWPTPSPQHWPNESDETTMNGHHLDLDIGMMLGEVRQGLRDIRGDTHEIRLAQGTHSQRLDELEDWRTTTQTRLDDWQTRKAERRAHQLKLAEKAGWYCASLIVAALTWSGKLSPELIKVLKAALAKAGAA